MKEKLAFFFFFSVTVLAQEAPPEAHESENIRYLVAAEILVHIKFRVQMFPVDLSCRRSRVAPDLQQHDITIEELKLFVGRSSNLMMQ